LCGKRLNNSPPSNTPTPSTRKNAANAPAKTDNADDLDESIIAHICVLSPNSARKIMENDANSGAKSMLI
jgi:hypothetical protein